MYVILFVVNLIFIFLLKFIEFCWSKVLNGFFRLVLMRYFFATFLHFLELACQFDCFMHSDWLYLCTINVVTFLFTVKYIYVYSSRIMKQELYMVNILIFYIHTFYVRILWLLSFLQAWFAGQEKAPSHWRLHLSL